MDQNVIEIKKKHTNKLLTFLRMLLSSKKLNYYILRTNLIEQIFI